MRQNGGRNIDRTPDEIISWLSPLNRGEKKNIQWNPPSDRRSTGGRYSPVTNRDSYRNDRKKENNGGYYRNNTSYDRNNGGNYGYPNK